MDKMDKINLKGLPALYELSVLQAIKDSTIGIETANKDIYNSSLVYIYGGIAPRSIEKFLLNEYIVKDGEKYSITKSGESILKYTKNLYKSLVRKLG